MVWERAELSHIVLHHEHTLFVLGSLCHIASQVLTKDLVLVNVISLNCGSFIKNLLKAKMGSHVSGNDPGGLSLHF